MARRGLLTQTAEPAKEILGVETIDVVADKGYFKIEDIEACEKAGIEPYVPRPQRGPSVKAGLFRKDESNTTKSRTAMFARLVSVFTPIHRRFCGG
jgi:hypothetical protein